MKTKTMYGIFALSVIALLGTGFVFAYQGNPSLNGPNYDDERHVAMQEAFDNVDYDAWLLLMQDIDHPAKGRVLEIINEENFPEFAKMHEAMEEGDFDLAQQIREELGLGLRDGQGKMDQGHRQGLHDGTHKGSGEGSMKGQGQGMHSGEDFRGNCPNAN